MLSSSEKNKDLRGISRVSHCVLEYRRPAGIGREVNQSPKVAKSGMGTPNFIAGTVISICFHGLLILRFVASPIPGFAVFIHEPDA